MPAVPKARRKRLKCGCPRAMQVTSTGEQQKGQTFREPGGTWRQGNLRTYLDLGIERAYREKDNR